MKRALFVTILLWPAVAAAGTDAEPVGDAARGERLYDSRCIGCHSLDANRVGPAHRDVYGRRAGAAADYPYSTALAAADVVWTSDTLDRWLADPEALIPGQRMNLRVATARDRADIIAYLRRESGG